MKKKKQILTGTEKVIALVMLLLVVMAGLSAYIAIHFITKLW